jgi:AraC-like DNA-binding protein
MAPHMDIVTYLPRNKFLQQHIDRYYFLKTTDAKFNSRYYGFPSLTTPLNIHRNVKIRMEDNFVGVSASAENNHCLILQGMRKNPLAVELTGMLDKITILFKPLGLNHFIKKKFHEVAANNSQMFKEWDEQPGFSEFITAFYATNDNDRRIIILETFLVSIYSPVKEYTVFNKAAQQLIDFNEEKSITGIATNLGFNTRTFDRHFKSLLGITPAGFRKIGRFRHSLNNKVVSDRFTTLTGLGYESNFYDQSYFINVYKEITGLNPGSFFKKVSRHSEAGLFFQYY